MLQCEKHCLATICSFHILYAYSRTLHFSRGWSTRIIFMIKEKILDCNEQPVGCSLVVLHTLSIETSCMLLVGLRVYLIWLSMPTNIACPEGVIVMVDKKKLATRAAHKYKLTHTHTLAIVLQLFIYRLMVLLLTQRGTIYIYKDRYRHSSIVWYRIQWYTHKP